MAPRGAVFALLSKALSKWEREGTADIKQHSRRPAVAAAVPCGTLHEPSTPTCEKGRKVTALSHRRKGGGRPPERQWLSHHEQEIRVGPRRPVRAGDLP